MQPDDALSERVLLSGLVLAVVALLGANVVAF
jgi:hypothetical protein